MSNDDRRYTPGGTNTVDGNYLRDTTINSRAARLHMARRGKWPGGRGRIIGNDLHNLQKMDESTPADVERMEREAWEPLTASGEMGDIVIESKELRDGTLGIEATYTDRTIGDSVSRELPTGRKG